MRFQSSKTVWFILKIHKKKSENLFYGCAKILNIYYQIPISVLTPLKLKIKQCQLKMWIKKEELNLAEPSEVRSLDFPLSLCQWES